jgi:hypothetical protein
MAVNVRIPNNTLPIIGRQRVYWKPRWNASWERNSHLWCESAEWQLFSGMSAASLRWRYGSGLAPGTTGFQTFAPQLGRLTYFVKVEYDVQPVVSASDPPLVWYGTIDVDIDEQLGPVLAGGKIANGRLHYVASGLERLFEDTLVLTSMIGDGSAPKRVNRGIGFNADGKPNQAEAGDPSGDKLFASNPTANKRYWNTRDAVRYLLKWHGPKDQNGDTSIPCELKDSALLPAWDVVESETHGRSTKELLAALIPRQRLMNAVLEVENDSRLIIRPFTYTADEIPITAISGASIRANRNSLRLDATRDRGGSSVIKRTVLDRADRVVVDGAPRTSTGTHCQRQRSLGSGWSAPQQAEYNTGSTLAPDYPPDDRSDLQLLRTINYRASEALRNVYARFVLPANWDGRVGDGVSSSATDPLMPSDSGGVSPLAADDWRFLPDLPFKANLDYSKSLTEPAKRATGEEDYVKPFALFPVKVRATDNPLRYRFADWSGITADFPLHVEALDAWSAKVEVKKDDGAIWVTIDQGFQHYIAKMDFVPTKLRIDQPAITSDWREMLVVASVAWSERCQGVWPPVLTTETDSVRTLRLPLGDAVRCDYVAPGCILGVDPSGRLIYAPSGFVRDDRPLCRALAQAAWSWYYPERATLDFTTSCLTSQIPLGWIVQDVGDPDSQDVPLRTVNSVVTSLRVNSPLVESETASEPPLPTMTVQTGHGELDVLKLVPLAQRARRRHRVTRAHA